MAGKDSVEDRPEQDVSPSVEGTPLSKLLRYMLAPEGQLGKVPYTIVDAHNDVFPYWATARQRAQAPPTLLHIDHHNDMNGYAPAWNKANQSAEEYTSMLNIANFIQPAVHYGIVGKVIWYDPRRGFTSYGTADKTGLSAPTSRQVEDRLEFVDATPTEVTSKAVLDHLQNPDTDIVLDIDLDAMLCVTDPVYSQRPKGSFEEMRKIVQASFKANQSILIDYTIENNVQQTTQFIRDLVPKNPIRQIHLETIDAHLASVNELLKQVPRPKCITIARSDDSGRKPWTPPEYADLIQDKVLRTVKELYKAE